MNGRLTITDVAKAVGVTPRTIMRWEKSGKIKKSRRDWRGWRFYVKEDIEDIKRFYETSYEYDETNGTVIAKVATIIAILALSAFLAGTALCVNSHAEANFNKTEAVKETPTSVDIDLNQLPAVNAPSTNISEGIKYTLGPNDVIAIDVRRHPEFSGQYPITSEGKIEYKYIGDITVSGLTKAQLKDRLTQILSEYVMEPDVDIQIVAYLSKLFYVVGEVRTPGKFYMKGDTVTVREALMQAGLPTYSAAMRRCRLITPDNNGKNNYTEVNVYKLLYEGDLKEDLVMKPSDVLYIPATAIAKMIQVISPVTNMVGQTAGAAATGAAIAP